MRQRRQALARSHELSIQRLEELRAALTTLRDQRDAKATHLEDSADLLDGIVELVLAEIELPSADAPFDRPDWLGDEVTDDPRYLNSVLAAAD